MPQATHRHPDALFMILGLSILDTRTSSMNCRNDCNRLRALAGGVSALGSKVDVGLLPALEHPYQDNRYSLSLTLLYQLSCRLLSALECAVRSSDQSQLVTNKY